MRPQAQASLCNEASHRVISRATSSGLAASSPVRMPRLCMSCQIARLRTYIARAARHCSRCSVGSASSAPASAVRLGDPQVDLTSHAALRAARRVFGRLVQHRDRLRGSASAPSRSPSFACVSAIPARVIITR